MLVQLPLVRQVIAHNSRDYVVRDRRPARASLRKLFHRRSCRSPAGQDDLTASKCLSLLYMSLYRHRRGSIDAIVLFEMTGFTLISLTPHFVGEGH